MRVRVAAAISVDRMMAVGVSTNLIQASRIMEVVASSQDSIHIATGSHIFGLV